MLNFSLSSINICEASEAKALHMQSARYVDKGQL